MPFRLGTGDTIYFLQSGYLEEFVTFLVWAELKPPLYYSVMFGKKLQVSLDVIIREVAIIREILCMFVARGKSSTKKKKPSSSPSEQS